MSQDKSKYREEAERMLNGDNNKWKEPFSYKLAVEALAKVLEDNSYLKEAVDYWMAKRKEEIEKEDKSDCEGCRDWSNKLMGKLYDAEGLVKVIREKDKQISSLQKTISSLMERQEKKTYGSMEIVVELEEQIASLQQQLKEKDRGGRLIAGKRKMIDLLSRGGKDE
jgi:anion-transporting  ArsA/GET3 family ATPase